MRSDCFVSACAIRVVAPAAKAYVTEICQSNINHHRGSLLLLLEEDATITIRKSYSQATSTARPFSVPPHHACVCTPPFVPNTSVAWSSHEVRAPSKRRRYVKKMWWTGGLWDLDTVSTSDVGSASSIIRNAWNSRDSYYEIVWTIHT